MSAPLAPLEVDDETLQTGDLLLFRGKSWLSSLLAGAQDSQYSHCAMVLNAPTWIDPRLTGIYYIEAGPAVMADPITGEKDKWGVHLQPIDAAWDSSHASVWVRRIRCTRDATFYERLQQVYTHVQMKPYTNDLCDWMNAFLFVNTGKHVNVSMPVGGDYDTEYWCSSLLGCIYMHIGLLPPDTTWSLLAPTAFSGHETNTPLAWTCTVDIETVFKRK